MNTAQIDEKLIPRLSKKMHSLAGQKCVILGGRVHGAVGQHDIPKAPALSSASLRFLRSPAHRTRRGRDKS